MTAFIRYELGLIALLALAVSVASAEMIFVKYRDSPVDVDNGHFEHIQLKPSSLVKGMYYDSSNLYLLVRLKHTFYHYCGIPGTVVSAWIESESLGRYYSGSIKGQYDCRLGRVPEY